VTTSLENVCDGTDWARAKPVGKHYNMNQLLTDSRKVAAFRLLVEQRNLYRFQVLSFILQALDSFEALDNF